MSTSARVVLLCLHSRAFVSLVVRTVAEAQQASPKGKGGFPAWWTQQCLFAPICLLDVRELNCSRKKMSSPRAQGAEEFRVAKRARDGVGEKLQPLPPAKRQRGVAFGSGVADEDDVYGMVC